MDIFLVGGAVRDKLLGLPVTEHDWVVVGATPEEMVELGYRPVGRDFPVFLHPDTHEEYALARTERKVAPGYKGFVFHTDPDVSLEEDLRRRDLTINAMAEDADGRLIDPFHGEEDLRAGLLRHVSDAFSEDPVRILRVARFAAHFGKWGFHVAHDTNALMRRMVESGEVNALVAERVWAELEKALGEDKPQLFFTVLRGCGALAVLFPALDAQFGKDGPAAPHAEQATVHALRALEACVQLTAATPVRFAALLMNLGSAANASAQQDAVITDLCDRYRVPNEYRALALLCARYHPDCHRAGELSATEQLDLLTRVDALRRPERFVHFLLACEADARAGGTADYPQAKRLVHAREAAAAVDAGKLLARGLKGEDLAAELRRLRSAAIEERETTPES